MVKQTPIFSTHRSRNNIFYLRKDDGTWLHEQSDIREAISSFYTFLLRIDHQFAHLKCMVNPSSQGSVKLNSHGFLESIHVGREIKEVVLSFRHHKALSPGGMYLFMYQNFGTSWGPLLLNSVLCLLL